MSKYEKAAKQREAEVGAQLGERVERKCSAFGCPELGSITHATSGPADTADWWCRHHYGEPAQHWPDITRRLRLAADERAPEPAPQISVVRTKGGLVDVAHYRRELRAMGPIGLGKPGKQWAEKLRKREQNGEQLSGAQRDAWRAALRFSSQAAEGCTDA